MLAGELPAIFGRELDDALHGRLRDRTVIGTTSEMIPRQIRVDQPVRRQEAAGAEPQSVCRSAAMSLVDRIRAVGSLSSRYSEHLLRVLAIGKRDRRAGEHDEGF